MAARIIFLSSYSLAARSYKQTHTDARTRIHKHNLRCQCSYITVFHYFILTIFVSSSMSWIDCSLTDKTSKVSLDSDLKGRDRKVVINIIIMSEHRAQNCLTTMTLIWHLFLHMNDSTRWLGNNWTVLLAIRNPIRGNTSLKHGKSDTVVWQIWQQWHTAPEKKNSSSVISASHFSISVPLVSVTHMLLQFPLLSSLSSRHWS